MEDIDLIVDFGDRTDAEAVLVHWVYEDGAPVRPGEIVAEAMVDKVALSIESPQAGYLVHLVEPNQVFHSKDAVGRIVQTVAAPENAGAPPSHVDTVVPQETIPATLAVRRYARDKGVDLNTVAAHIRPHHRLTMADIDGWIADHHTMAEEPYSPFRRSVIQHLTNPGALPTTLQRRIAAGTATFPALARIAWAVSQALPRHQKIHGWATAEGFTPAQDVVLGIAAQTSAGLLVPVLPAHRTLEGWAESLRTLRQAVQANDLASLDFSRPSFVLSNLGPQGIEYFTPRLMTPTVAILGIGQGNDTTFPVSLTFDHRAIDGAEAAEFLVTVHQLLSS
ncbi:MAG: dihydrolipoamide succinyltransferase [Sulfobacillus benefaciens]|uniref:Dihydrolipoamide acetyltransferase component of pyruvate dehydrogenase complex n=1 Tax=Sulfobacillus benefaciens TaxID=453960 RepID=A0A2T2XIS6_9FIRM|nr:MAG: dihydrolipoamide succinyltransferase [Sulfobacillus benefaciens]